MGRSVPDRVELAKERFAAIGTVTAVGPMQPENQLRGAFEITGDRGRLRVSFAQTPESEPEVQELTLVVLAPK